MTISSHVLDTASGRPARGLVVRLDVLDEERWTNLSEVRTDDDGRVRRLAPEGPLRPGTYRVTFETRAYLEAAGLPVFYPSIDVVFVLAEGDAHYHVPLLLSPYGYSTYRGS
jgi:5-hydroxyisourate hydrolase